MIKKIIGVLVVWVLQACTAAAPDVVMSHDDALAAMRTYALMPRDALQTNETVISDTLRNRLELAIESVMEAKGYHNVPRDVADMQIAYYVITRPQRALGSRLRDDSVCQTCSDESTLGSKRSKREQGTLMIQLKDRLTGKIVWQASAPGAINTKVEMDNRKEQVNNAVNHLLNQLPSR